MRDFRLFNIPGTTIYQEVGTRLLLWTTFRTRLKVKIYQSKLIQITSYLAFPFHSTLFNLMSGYYRSDLNITWWICNYALALQAVQISLFKHQSVSQGYGLASVFQYKSEQGMYGRLAVAHAASLRSSWHWSCPIKAIDFYITCK